MFKTIEVEFDGKVLVPAEPIDFPARAKFKITIHDTTIAHQSGPITNERRAMTDEEKRQWEQLRREWRETPGPFSTVEEAKAYSRGRPWPNLLLLPDSLDQTTTIPNANDSQRE